MIILFVGVARVLEDCTDGCEGVNLVLLLCYSAVQGERGRVAFVVGHL